MIKQTITPCLWFDRQAEEAMNFYLSIFKNSHVIKLSYYGEGAPLPKGTVLKAQFSLDGQEFLALNGAAQFPFTPAISLVINCETQAEVDDYWQKLSEGGAPHKCGWLYDKFGLAWQIVPTILGKLMSNPDEEATQRVMAAVLQMIKLDIAQLQQAYENK